jgi:hypothetical protein
MLTLAFFQYTTKTAISCGVLEEGCNIFCRSIKADLSGVVILDLYRTTRVLIAQLMSLFCFPASYLRSQRALQWWQQTQSRQLSCEAEKIRDGLLQESFTIRRILELSLLNEDLTSTQLNQDLLEKMENFYHSLEQLSERLSPAYIEDSLPLAIQGVVESWRTCNSNVKIEMDLPAAWRQEPLDRSLLILKILDELLQMSSSEILTELSIHISLKQQGNIGELIVHISYPDVPTLVSYWSKEDLEYLSQTFQFLIAGQCCRLREELTVVWYFRWFTQ